MVLPALIRQAGGADRIKLQLLVVQLGLEIVIEVALLVDPVLQADQDLPIDVTEDRVVIPVIGVSDLMNQLQEERISLLVLLDPGGRFYLGAGAPSAFPWLAFACSWA